MYLNSSYPQWGVLFAVEVTTLMDRNPRVILTLTLTTKWGEFIPSPPFVVRVTALSAKDNYYTNK